jgi:multiple sugar transport system substrate-binding protein
VEFSRRELLRRAMAATLLTAAGCRRRGSEGLGGPTPVTFASFGNTFEVEVLHLLIDRFERDNPDVRVKYVHIPQNYDPVLLTMIAGGSAPDLFYVLPYTLGDMISKGVLMDLDPFVARSRSVHIADFFPQTVAPYRWDGRRFGEGPLFGICKDWSPDYLIYFNKNLFDAAGIPHPDGSWTRDEFVEIAQRLTKQDERGRIVQFGVYNNCNPEQWAREGGGRFFSDDGSRSLLDTPAVVDSLQWSADLSNRWHVAPGYAEQQQGAVDVMFETGRVAMCFYGQWFAPQFRKAITTFRWGVTTPPRDRVDVYLAGGMVGYGIYAHTPHPEAAWRLMEFLVGPDGQTRMAKIGWNIPSNQGIAYSPVFRANPDLDRTVTETFLRAAERTRLFEISHYINPAEWNLLFQPEWELALLGEKSVADALRAASRQIDQAIRDNRAILGEEAQPPVQASRQPAPPQEARR